MPYTSIFSGQAGTLPGGKVNPFAGDFQPGQYAAVNSAIAAKHIVPVAGDKTNLSIAIQNLRNFNPNDQVRIINRASKVGIINNNHASSLVSGILNNQQSATPGIPLSPTQKALSGTINFGKQVPGAAKTLGNVVTVPVQPLANKIGQQFSYLSGPTATQAQQAPIVKNQSIPLPKNNAGAAAGIQARNMVAAGAPKAQVTAYLNKATQNMNANEKSALGQALSLASLTVGGGELAGVKGVAGATRAVAPLAAATGVGNVGNTLATNPNASGKQLLKSGAEGVAAGAALPFAGAAVAKGVEKAAPAIADLASKVHANKIANDEKIAPVHVSETNNIPTESKSAPKSAETPTILGSPSTARTEAMSANKPPAIESNAKTAPAATKATTEPTNAGTKQAGSSVKLNKEFVEKGFTQRTEGLPEFEGINKKEQVAKATDLVNNDRQKAIDIVQGKVNPPDGLHPVAVHNALVAAVRKEGNGDLADIVARASTNRELSEHGQGLSLAAERDPYDPVEANRSIAATREKAFERTAKKSAGTAQSSEIKAIREAKATVKGPSKQDWNSFVESLKC